MAPLLRTTPSPGLLTAALFALCALATTSRVRAAGQDPVPGRIGKELVQQLRSDEPEVREAAERTMRTLARASIACDDLQWMQDSYDESGIYIPPGASSRGYRIRSPMVHDPFRLAAAFRDPRPEVRAVGAAMLRVSQGLEPRSSTLAAMGGETREWTRELWTRCDVPEQLLPRILAAARAGRADLALGGRFAHLDPDRVLQFAMQVVQAVEALPAQEPPRAPGSPARRLFTAPRSANDEVAFRCLTRMMQIAPRVRLHVLSRAMNTPIAWTRRCAMEALDHECVQVRLGCGPPIDPAMGALAAALLDSEDLVESFVAAELLFGMPRLGDVECAQVTERAVRIGADRLQTLCLEPADSRPVLGQTKEWLRDAYVVAAAAKNGAAAIVTPLIDDLASHPHPAIPHRTFLTDCLLGVLHLAEPEQLRRAAPQVRIDPWLSRLRVAMYHRVPYGVALYLEPREGWRLDREWASSLKTAPVPLPPHTLDMLRRADWRQVEWFHIVPLVPELLFEAIDAGDAARAARIGMGVAGELPPRLLEGLLRRDPELVAAAVMLCLPRPLPLSLLVHVREVEAVRGSLASYLAAALVEENELPVLRSFLGVDEANVAAAVARRVRGKGVEGDTLYRETLQRLCAGTPEAAGLALRLMLEVGEAVDGWRDAVARAGDPDRHHAAAARLRFGGEAIDADLPDPCLVLTLARCDVDVESLRRLPHGDQDLCRMMGSVERAQVAALQLAQEVPVWSPGLERLILTFTSHEDPAVRRAAYLALQTRDPELWPCAWLVHEVEFDPDPSVRSLPR